MKTTLLFLIAFCFNLFGFAQTKTFLQGTVLFENQALQNVDVVNFTTRKSVSTDTLGKFNIEAKLGNEIYFIAKDYVDLKIKITKSILKENNLVIHLEKKPIELDDVEITNVPKVKFEVSQAEIDAIKLSKKAGTPKVLNVYDGQIENGIDFIRLGKDLISIFKNKDKEKTKKPQPTVSFKEHLSPQFDTTFYTQKLKLKPEEIELFIAYCEADPKAKQISENNNLLDTMDFLISKNEEFKKLRH